MERTSPRGTLLLVEDDASFAFGAAEFLARRGFPYSVIAPIVTRLWSEAHMDDQAKNFEDEDIS